MRVGMAGAVAACAALALAPLAFVRSLDEVLATMSGIGAREPVRGAVEVRLSGITGSMSPLLIAIGLAAGAVLVVALLSRAPADGHRVARHWSGDVGGRG